MELEPSKLRNRYICELHFDASCSNNTTRGTLKPGSVPIKFKPTPVMKTPSPSQKLLHSSFKVYNQSQDASFINFHSEMGSSSTPMNAAP